MTGTRSGLPPHLLGVLGPQGAGLWDLSNQEDAEADGRGVSLGVELPLFFPRAQVSCSVWFRWRKCSIASSVAGGVSGRDSDSPEETWKW